MNNDKKYVLSFQNELFFKTILKQEIFQIVTNLITPLALFSPIFLQSSSHDNGSDNAFQR